MNLSKQIKELMQLENVFDFEEKLLELTSQCFEFFIKDGWIDSGVIDLEIEDDCLAYQIDLSIDYGYSEAFTIDFNTIKRRNKDLYELIELNQGI